MENFMHSSLGEGIVTMHKHCLHVLNEPCWQLCPVFLFHVACAREMSQISVFVICLLSSEDRRIFTWLGWSMNEWYGQPWEISC